MAASAFIRARPAGGPKYLFNLDANDLTDEANFRTTLTELENSLNGFVAIGSGTNYTINMGNFFSGDTSVQSLLPTQTTNRAGFIWNSFPDTTLGHVITGLTQTNLGKLFLKEFHEEAQLDVPTLAFTVVSAAGSSFNQSSQDGYQGTLNGVVLGAGGTFMERCRVAAPMAVERSSERRRTQASRCSTRLATTIRMTIRDPMAAIPAVWSWETTVIFTAPPVTAAKAPTAGKTAPLQDNHQRQPEDRVQLRRPG